MLLDIWSSYSRFSKKETDYIRESVMGSVLIHRPCVRHSFLNAQRSIQWILVSVSTPLSAGPLVIETTAFKHFVIRCTYMCEKFGSLHYGMISVCSTTSCFSREKEWLDFSFRLLNSYQFTFPPLHTKQEMTLNIKKKPDFNKKFVF